MQSPSSSTTDHSAMGWAQVLILLAGLALILAVLLPQKPGLPQITALNIDKLHEVLQLPSGLPGYALRQFALSPDGGTLLVTAGYNNDLWRLADGTKQSMNLKGAGGFTPFVFFYQNRPIAAFEDWATNVRFLDMESGATLQQFGRVIGREPMQDWIISPDGQWMISSDLQQTLSVRNILTGEQRFSIAAPEGYVFVHTNPTFSADGKILATSLRVADGAAWDIFLWDAVNGAALQHLHLRDAVHINSMAFSHDGRWLAVGGGFLKNSRTTTIFQLWDLKAGALSASWLGGGLPAQNLAFTADDHYLAAQGYGNVWLWDVSAPPQDERAHLFLKGNGSTLNYNTMALSHDGTLMAAGDTGNGILIYEVASAQLLKTLKGHRDRVTALTFSDDDQLLISSSEDRTVRFWSVGDYQPPPAVGRPAQNTLPAPQVTPTIAAVPTPTMYIP